MEWLEQLQVTAEPTPADKIYATLEKLMWGFSAGLVIWSCVAIWL
jgi:hypothetical protein